MLARIWIVLLSLLLLAAPGDTHAEAVSDGDVAASLYADEALPHTPIPAPAPPLKPAAHGAGSDQTLPPAPVVSRIFRPPRRPFA